MNNHRPGRSSALPVLHGVRCLWAFLSNRAGPDWPADNQKENRSFNALNLFWHRFSEKTDGFHDSKGIWSLAGDVEPRRDECL
jgi:hypothetical protein